MQLRFISALVAISFINLPSVSIANAQDADDAHEEEAPPLPERDEKRVFTAPGRAEVGRWSALGGPGESCRARSDCAFGLRCVSGRCSSDGFIPEFVISLPTLGLRTRRVLIDLEALSYRRERFEYYERIWDPEIRIAHRFVTAVNIHWIF
jgi:hypothetical protein